MKKLTLLCLLSEREATLEVLQKAGVVHITDVQEPFGSDVDETQARLSSARGALEAVESAAAIVGSRKRRRAEEDDPPSGAGKAVSSDAIGDAPALVEKIEQLVEQQRDLRDRAEAVQRELARVAPLGEFDPAMLATLAQEGVFVRLLQVSSSAKELAAPEGFVVEKLSADKKSLYVALVSRSEFDLDEVDLGVPFTEVRPPEAAPSRLRSELEEAEQNVDAIEHELARLAEAKEPLHEYIVKLEQEAELASARAGMGVADTVAYLQGYAPADTATLVKDLAAKNEWGCLLEDPAHGEDVPTALRYSGFVRPIRVVFDFLKIYPGYWETDIGWTFLVFFSIFFAMIAADAGYAIMLLALTVVLQIRLKKVPPYVFHMMYIVGGMTLIWGVLTANYLGIPSLPPFLEGLKVDWLAERDNLIFLCFILGAVHLSIAHIWNIKTLVSRGTRGKAIAQFGNLLVVWGMFFLASQTVLGIAMPGFVLYMLGAGFVLILVFMATPQEMKQSLIQHALLPLNMISNFVDVLSYIRLFAVGYASIAVVAAFTEMASSIGFDSAFTAIAAVLLLVFAHMLNLVLIGLGVLVHAVRLNTLEFSTHKGLTWAGHLVYKPLAMRKGTGS